MKYFIDFEATQYSHEIISVGCVREDGQTFKSFVHVKPSKMSNFITQLTGITKEDVRNAPTSDEVFNNFYHWIEGDTEMEFYCYGDADIEFIRTNLSKTTDMLAISALSIIGTNLNDFAPEAKRYFGLHKMISLKKLVAYYRNVEAIEQAHDALEDSLFLKEVYDHIMSEEADLDAFPEYRIDETSPKVQAKLSKKKKKALSLAALMEADKTNIGLVRYSKNHCDEWACGNLYIAIMRCIKRMKQNNPNNKDDVAVLYPEIRKNILQAIKDNTRYCKYYWRKEDKE